MKIENFALLKKIQFSQHGRLEPVFLEAMLRHVIPEMRASGFDGGVGEEHFSSFLNSEYAKFLSRKIDLGIELNLNERH